MKVNYNIFDKEIGVLKNMGTEEVEAWPIGLNEVEIWMSSKGISWKVKTSHRDPERAYSLACEYFDRIESKYGGKVKI